MKKALLVTGLVFVLLIAWGAISVYQSFLTPPPIDVERDIVYGKGGDEELKLDLAKPKQDKGPYPAVVCLHGSGWRFGTRQEMNGIMESLAHMGYVGVTVSYRLAPAAQFPAQIEDIKAAVRWLRANSEKYQINRDRIGVVGFSAGGHLACLLGATDAKDGLEGNGGNPEQSSRVQAVVSFCGPTDFTTRDWPEDVEKGLVEPFLGGTFKDKPEVYKRASPINYVTADDPPFLLIHGIKDPLIPVDQAKRFLDKLQEAGVSVQLNLENGGHGWEGPAMERSVREILSFLDERLKH
jgi:acetyl esterase/lipase